MSFIVEHKIAGKIVRQVFAYFNFSDLLAVLEGYDVARVLKGKRVLMRDNKVINDGYRVAKRKSHGAMGAGSRLSRDPQTE